MKRLLTLCLLYLAVMLSALGEIIYHRKNGSLSTIPLYGLLSSNDLESDSKTIVGEHYVSRG